VTDRPDPERLFAEMLEPWRGDPDVWLPRLLRRRDELIR
jgi:hypothetical protein